MQTDLLLTPFRVHGTHPHKKRVRVKDPVSICRTRAGLTAGGMETRKHCMQEGKKKLGSAVLWLLAFPDGSSPNVPCIALGQDSYVIQSNLI